MSFRETNPSKVARHVPLVVSCTPYAGIFHCKWHSFKCLVPCICILHNICFVLVIILKEGEKTLQHSKRHWPICGNVPHVSWVIIPFKDREFSSFLDHLREHGAILYAFMRENYSNQLNSLQLALWKHRQNAPCKCNSWLSAVVSKNLYELRE